jgi:hypothetical protein
MVYPPEDHYLLGPREGEIIQHLLRERGITEYFVVEPVEEGEGLSDAPEDSQAWSTSGYIVTLDAFHTFWLDWDAPHQCYTLGNFFDYPSSEEDVKSMWGTGPILLKAQECLRQKQSN